MPLITRQEKAAGKVDSETEAMIERATVPHRSAINLLNPILSPYRLPSPLRAFPREFSLPWSTDGCSNGLVVFKIPVRRLTRRVLHSASAKVALTLLSEGSPIIEDPIIMS